MALHFVAFALCIFSVVLLLLTNIATTFPSEVLNKLYFVQISQSATSSSIRYGLYNSCLYNQNILKYCTPKTFAYTFDIQQFVEASGAQTNSTTNYAQIVSSSTFNSLFRYIVLIMPSTILAFISFCLTLILRKGRRSSVLPLIGAFTTLLSFFSGAAGLALLIVTFWKGLDILESRAQGLSHQWGPLVYMTGVGIGCILVAFVCFVLSAFSQKAKNETSDLTNYNNLPNTTEISKHDSYTDHSPTKARYPSYHRQPESNYPTPYPQNDTYHDTYQHNNAYPTYTPQVYEQVYDNYTLPQSHHQQHAYDHYNTNKPRYV